MSYIEGSTAVTLEEVAKATKRTLGQVQIEARTLGLYVGEDWAGREAVTEQDARALVTGSQRAQREHDSAWAAHLAATAAWEAERSQVSRDAQLSAYQETITRTAQAPVGGVYMAGAKGDEPAARAAATEAGRDAVERFERTRPMPTFQGHTTGQSWLKRAADKLTGTPR